MWTSLNFQGLLLSVEKVQSLLQSLQSVYEKELQKVMTGETNPTRTYKSEWRWFLFLDSFIRNHVLQKVAYSMYYNTDFHNKAIVKFKKNETVSVKYKKLCFAIFSYVSLSVVVVGTHVYGYVSFLVLF